MKKNILLLIAMMLLTSIGAFAQIPSELSIQGYAEDAADKPYDGSINVKFEIWDAETGGSPLFSQTATALPATAGYFEFRTVGIIGSQIATTESPLWYQFTIEGVAQPRVLFSAVPYSISSEWSKRADVALQADPTGPAGGDLMGEYPAPTLNPDRVYTILDNYINTKGIDAVPKGPAGGDIGGNYPNELLIKDRAVRPNHIALNAVKNEHIAAGAVTMDKLPGGNILNVLPSITGAEGMVVVMAYDDYYGWNWTSGADIILAGDITTAKLADNAVTAIKLATNAVTADKIADGAVTAAKIVAGAVGITHLATPTDPLTDQFLAWNAQNEAWEYKNMSDIVASSIDVSAYNVPFQNAAGALDTSFIFNYPSGTAGTPADAANLGGDVVDIQAEYLNANSIFANTGLTVGTDNVANGATIYGDLDIYGSTDYPSSNFSITGSGNTNATRSRVSFDSVDFGVTGSAFYSTVNATDGHATPYTFTDLASVADSDSTFASIGFVKWAVGQGGGGSGVTTSLRDSITTAYNDAHRADSVAHVADSSKLQNLSNVNVYNIPYLATKNPYRVANSPISTNGMANHVDIAAPATYKNGTETNFYIPGITLANPITDSMLATVSYVKNSTSLEDFDLGDVLSIDTAAGKNVFAKSRIWSSVDSALNVVTLNNLFNLRDNIDTETPSIYPKTDNAGATHVNTVITGNVLFNTIDSGASESSRAYIYMPNHSLTIGQAGYVVDNWATGIDGGGALNIFTFKDKPNDANDYAAIIVLPGIEQEYGTYPSLTNYVSSENAAGNHVGFQVNFATAFTNGLGGRFAISSGDTTDDLSPYSSAGLLALNIDQWFADSEYFESAGNLFSVPNPALSVTGILESQGAIVARPVLLDEITDISDPSEDLGYKVADGAKGNSKTQYGTIFKAPGNGNLILGHGWDGQIIYVVNTRNDDLAVIAGNKQWTLGTGNAMNLIFIADNVNGSVNGPDGTTPKGDWYLVTSPVQTTAP